MKFLLIVIFSGLLSLLPIIFSGFGSFQGTVLSILLAVVFGYIYSRTREKKYIYILGILLAVMIVPTSLPIDYPYCGNDFGYGTVASKDCSCAGLIRSHNNREQCVGVRLGCYDMPRTSGNDRAGILYMQQGSVPNETEARIYFDKVAKEKYGPAYNGTIDLDMVEEPMTKVLLRDGGSYVCETGAENCPDIRLGSEKISETQNIVEWYGRFGISCSSMDAGI